MRLVEFFSGVIDASSKKFDECYDICEVLNEKAKLRFKDIDGLLIKVQQIVKKSEWFNEERHITSTRGVGQRLGDRIGIDETRD